MSFRGGRDRQWKDYPLRPEEKSRHGRSTAAPPSRHLWVGNLSHTLTERALSNHFRQFGELESVGFSPGRSYAFINFIEESAAFAAFGALQGLILAGNALRIEFTKAEEDDYLRRPRSPFPHRDSGIRHSDSDSIQRSSTNKDDEEPNEVLWVGFPQSLKVDEQIFRDAFSQFGEINSISTYPGRTYAFIRYKHVNSAIRAKETLQGKLFNNPRVHITFARSESRTLNTAKNDLPLSPRYNNRYHDDRKRKSPEGRNRNHGFRDMNDGYGRLRRSPTRDRNVIFHDFQQPRRFGDEWDLPEDGLVYKKMKGGAIPIPIPAELELPEYPFSDSEHVMRPPGFDGNKNNGMGHFGFHNNNQMIPDSRLNVVQNYGERGNVRNMQNAQNAPEAVYGGFHGGPVSLGQNVVEWKRLTPESQIPGSDEWKWEGVIAKGGTAICRARCFPVGKVLDMILPEFLDCTARTSLDMLSKHYYQAAASYVVFFVPESDADMAFYNEFMNYLGEKQRAAVAKLDEKTTLFLVPPSDFSEKILKVPGKLSISGVILRLEQPPPTATPPPPPHHRHPESSRTSYVSPSGPGPFQVQPGHQGFPNAGKPRPGLTALYNGDNMQDQQHLVNRQNQEMNLSNYHGQQEVKSGGGFGIQGDQLAQLASFLGRQTGEEIRQGSDNGYRMPPHQQMVYHQAPSQPQYNQGQQFQQVGQSSGQGNGQEEEADPQKRLQATLELAATLLKQIQQGKT